MGGQCGAGENVAWGDRLSLSLTLPLEEVCIRVAPMFGARPIPLPGCLDNLQQVLAAHVDQQLV